MPNGDPNTVRDKMFVSNVKQSSVKHEDGVAVLAVCSL